MTKDVLKGVLESPVMKNPGQLINSFSLQIDENTLNEVEPALLSSLARNPSFTDLFITADKQCRQELQSRSHMFVGSLTRVEFYKGEIMEGDVFALGKLPHLVHLRLGGSYYITGGVALFFPAYSFPRLTKLIIEDLARVWKLEAGEGSLPRLQKLELIKCGTLNEWVLPKGALPDLQILSWVNQRILSHFCQSISQNIPINLKEVTIGTCMTDGKSLAALAKLPYLQKLHITKIRGDNLRFHPGSFPCLIQFE